MAASSVTTTIAGQLSTRRDVMSVASGESNVVAVDTTSTKLDQVIIDNSAGTAQVYLRIWALASGSVSLGSSAPIFILTAGAGESVEYSFAPAPVVETALSAQLVQTSGYDASGTAVTWAVTITFLTHDS
tara:strand:- start:31 stop:420 length:390 start_codon:yes stop_codon:yes gene_type:complete